jgi:hypothetical protein
VVSSYSPAKGTVGSEIRIFGSHFGNDALAIKVELGSQAQEIVSVRDDALLVRVVPGAQTGVLSVTTALQGTTSVQPSFVVLPVLVVLNVTPEHVAVGNAVEVRGAGFEAGAVVRLGEQVIEPEALTPERLRFVVPSGATGGLLTVKLRDGREATAPRTIVVAP